MHFISVIRWQGCYISREAAEGPETLQASRRLSDEIYRCSVRWTLHLAVSLVLFICLLVHALFRCKIDL